MTLVDGRTRYGNESAITHPSQYIFHAYFENYGSLLGEHVVAFERFDLFGHQLVAHLAPPRADVSGAGDHHNEVDGHHVPVPHFGVVLDWDQFDTFAATLRASGVKFAIEPYVRFAGLVGEQATMFFYDPSGNALEFKAFKDRGQLFAK